MTKENKNNIPKAKHDEVFKKVLAYPKIAQDFFDMHLPSSVKSLMNLQTLKLEKESFIKDDLSCNYSDVLFSVNIDSNTNTPLDKFNFKIKK